MKDGFQKDRTGKKKQTQIDGEKVELKLQNFKHTYEEKKNLSFPTFFAQLYVIYNTTALSCFTSFPLMNDHISPFNLI